MKTRKAISPVLATVILIAITLVAAFAVAGFIFGLFGTFENTPRVSATSTLSSANGLSGIVTLYNSGNSPASVQSVSLTYNGQTCQALFDSTGSEIQPSGSMSIHLQAGSFSPGSNSYNCGQEGTTSVASPSQQYTGQITITGGFLVPITGAFQ